MNEKLEDEEERKGRLEEKLDRVQLEKVCDERRVAHALRRQTEGLLLLAMRP